MKLPLYQPTTTALPARSAQPSSAVGDPTGAGLAQLGAAGMAAAAQWGNIAAQEARDQAAEDARAERARKAAEKAKQDYLDDIDATTDLNATRDEMDVVFRDLKQGVRDPVTDEVTTPAAGPREFMTEYEKRANVARNRLLSKDRTPGAQQTVQKGALRLFGDRTHDARVFSDTLAKDYYDAKLEKNLESLEDRIARETDPEQRALLEEEANVLLEKARGMKTAQEVEARRRLLEERVDTNKALQQATQYPGEVIGELRGPQGPTALSGELGTLRRPGGGVSTELSITVTDPRLNDGQPTNIPLLVKGQQGVDALLAGQMPTAAQQEHAIQRAAARVAEGAELPAYGSMEEAGQAAMARSAAGGRGFYRLPQAKRVALADHIEKEWNARGQRAIAQAQHDEKEMHDAIVHNRDATIGALAREASNGKLTLEQLDEWQQIRNIPLGPYENIRKIITEGPKDAPSNRDLYTRLSIAIKTGDPTVTRTLLAQFRAPGGGLNQKDYEHLDGALKGEIDSRRAEADRQVTRARLTEDRADRIQRRELSDQAREDAKQRQVVSDQHRAYTDGLRYLRDELRFPDDFRMQNEDRARWADVVNEFYARVHPSQSRYESATSVIDDMLPRFRASLGQKAQRSYEEADRNARWKSQDELNAAIIQYNLTPEAIKQAQAAISEYKAAKDKRDQFLRGQEGAKGKAPAKTPTGANKPPIAND